MPYIPENERASVEPTLISSLDTPGELNYALTKLIDRYIQSKGLGYREINEAIGALECAKLELYRRIAVPYEEQKLEQNGDVYDSRNLP